MSQRCGWCITADHPNCVVVVEMGHHAGRGRPKSEANRSKRPDTYVWRCKCSCEYAQAAKCVDCQRVGVDLTKNRCTDVADCDLAAVKVPVRPMLEKGRL